MSETPSEGQQPSQPDGQAVQQEAPAGDLTQQQGVVEQTAPQSAQPGEGGEPSAIVDAHEAEFDKANADQASRDREDGPVPNQPDAAAPEGSQVEAERRVEGTVPHVPQEPGN